MGGCLGVSHPIFLLPSQAGLFTLSSWFCSRRWFLFLFSAKKKAEMYPYPTLNHPPWDGFWGVLGVPSRPPQC